ncbi:MAG: class II aldolase/adducin family protein [Candidatus Omnitrophota bacterium]|nr:class II aldolase/adducin family protein [Candidatus Omnitrophota bacterium]MDZ4241625.1 class II aldolase/adducin family protein [Candidatus Omnitrophota bacterium]
MSETVVKNLKTGIIAIGRLLWEKELVTGLNGNISSRVDEETVLITATKTCLGLLQDKDVLRMNLTGEVLEDGQVSSERLLHTEIYRNFPDAKAVIHTHTTFTNAYFLENDSLTPRIFESKFYLGEVSAVPQTTPSVTDAGPVIEALKANSITVLKNHGVVAMGKDLFDCFLLIQCLEDAVKMDAISRLYARESEVRGQKSAASTGRGSRAAGHSKKYKLFSKEQIDEIVRLVNADRQLAELGAKTNMTMDLGVLLNETGQVYSFHFDKGRIVRVGNEEGVEFLISAPEKIWRAVFNREIDPFVATTQKKMALKGDFARISKWYAPCSRIFELWAQAPVE